MNNHWPSLYQYLLKPHYRETDSSVSAQRAILLCLVYYGAMLLVNIAQYPLLYPVAGLINETDSHMYQNMESLRDEPWLLLFFLVILAPLLEEAWFRFGLRRYHWKIMAIWSLLMVPIIFIFFFDSIKLSLFSAFSISLFFGLFLYFFTKKQDVSDEIWHRYFPHIFWGSSLIFGLAHYSNFLGVGFSLALLYFLLIYTLSRALLGAIMAYIRMRLGFVYAVFIHALNNALPAFVILSVPDDEWQKIMGLIF